MFYLVPAALAALLAVGLASAQMTPPDSFPVSFEVASVKSAAPCCAAGQWRESKAGEDRIDFRYVTLRYCVAFAYRVKEYQVSGPAWLGETRYDILAKGPTETRHDELPDMMRQLLAERFHLQAHRETREFNVLVLAMGKAGPKLKESAAATDNAEGARIGMSMSPAGVGRIEVRHGNMAAFANTLARLLGRPVVDMTGLTARYDFEVAFAREDSSTMMPPSGPFEIGDSVFASVQRLGLKLEPRKPLLDAIVVDQVANTPTEN